MYGEEKFVIMLGGLHIEKAALFTVRDWLKGSGWTTALVQADVTTPGTADSFMKVSHYLYKTCSSDNTCLSVHSQEKSI